VKALAIQVGATVLVTLALAIGLGWVVWQYGGAGVVRVLRDVSIIILAIFSFIMAAVWGGIYFGAAWAIGRFGGKATGGAHWVGQKTLWVEERVEIGMERFVTRPFARGTRAVVTGATFGRELVVGPAARIDFRYAVTRWRTRLNRLRGRASLPPTPDEPARRGQRDVQPGPGIAA
jgi:hypothetical protein